MTSHEAAESVERVSKVQVMVLRSLATWNNLTDEQILHWTTTWGYKVSASGLRSRRSELVKAGLVEDSGERGKTASGRKTIIWRLTEAGWRYMNRMDKA